MLSGHFTCFFNIIHLQYSSAALCMRAFEAKKFVYSCIGFLFSTDEVNVLDLDGSISLVVHRHRHHSSKWRYIGPLPVIHEAHITDHSCFALRSAMQHQAHCIRHRPTWHQKCSFLAEELRHLVLQIIYGWIIVEHIVSHGCLHHLFAKSLRWLGHRVASEVDELWLILVQGHGRNKGKGPGGRMC